MAFDTAAQKYHARHDSLWVYNTWESLMCQAPDALLINPVIEAYTPYDIAFETLESEANDMLYNYSLAVALGDSVWLINSRVLRQSFKGDVKKMDDYVPFYFNAKMAFIEAVTTYSFGSTLLNSIFGSDETGAAYNEPPDLFWIDFEHGKIDRITHKNLSAIMELYPDLVRRYEAMASHKDREVVHFFFYEFVRRAEQDQRYPYLLDRLGEE